MTDWKVYLIVAACLLIAGYSFGRYVQPARIETKIVTQTNTTEDVHKNVETTTTETDKSDGTKEIVTTTIDKSQSDTVTDTHSTMNTTTVRESPQWTVSAQFTPGNAAIGYFYGVHVQRRILGPVFAGAFANTDRAIGLSVGLEF